MRLLKSHPLLHITTTLFLLLPVVAFSTDYYISNGGNNKNSGLTPQLAWQTIDKLNQEFRNINPGDTIFFKRGESFYGSVAVTKSGMYGKPIVFTAYGKGYDPIITGFTNITGWIKKEGGIWQAPAPGVKANLNMVTIDGMAQRIGRYPNFNAPDGGYLRYENFTTSKSISDNELNDGVNWTGAEVVIRKNHWTAERCRVTKQEGNTIFYTNANGGINPLKEPNLYQGLKGNGYFFQKDARTLDQYGEWFFDSTNGNLQLFWGDVNVADHTVKASAIDTLVNTGDKSFISFSDLSFEGANRSGIYNKSGGNITIQHCSFNNIGAKAIHFWNTENVLIDYVNTGYVLSNAIQVRNGSQSNVTVKNCVVKNTGPFIGMGSFFDDRDYKGITVMVKNNAVIENNIVDTTGSSGIQFQGSNVLVQQNLVNYYCYLLDDGAGIYTFSEFTEENRSDSFINRAIKSNIVLNGIGAPEGSIKLYKAEGIYLDGRTINVEVTGNTIAFTGNKALACNNPVNVTFRNNTCYNTGGGWGASRTITWDDIHHLEVKQNIFYSASEKQSLVNFSHSGLDIPTPVSIWEAIRLLGEIDSNYYNTVNPAGFIYSYAPVAGKPGINPSPLTFEHWKEFTGQDLHSKQPFKILPRYIFKQQTGNNLVQNGKFENDSKGANVFGSNTNGEWDNSGKVTGYGSLRVEFNVPQSNTYSLVHGEIGNVQAGKKYIFRFNTVGNSDCGIVRAYIRKTAMPYTALATLQTQVFGTLKQRHEFLFTAAASEKASYAIEIEKNSCTTYLDDIELYEAEATNINIKEQVRFEYNTTDTAVEVILDKNYIGVDGTPYSGTLTLPAFSSKILIPLVVN